MTSRPTKTRTARLRRFLVPHGYSSPVLVVFLSAAMGSFAWTTTDLLNTAMANTRFLREFGVEAIQHGGLLQSAQIVGQALLALFFWMVFRVCEAELLRRWLRAESDEEFDE